MPPGRPATQHRRMTLTHKLLFVVAGAVAAGIVAAGPASADVPIPTPRAASAADLPVPFPQLVDGPSPFPQLVDAPGPFPQLVAGPGSFIDPNDGSADAAPIEDPSPTG